MIGLERYLLWELDNSDVASIELFLPVDPACLPTAQQKGFDRRSGRFYTKPRVREAKARLEWAISRALADWGTVADGCPVPALPMAGAVMVRLDFVYNPKGLRAADRGAPKPTRPDLDNLAKLVLDAITAVKSIWRDDSQVAQLTLAKRFARANEVAHIELEVKPHNIHNDNKLKGGTGNACHAE